MIQALIVPISGHRHGQATNDAIMLSSLFTDAESCMQGQTTPPPDPDLLRNALTQVIDPEVGMNIVDLGLIYDIRIAAEHIEVDLTMTTPACPMSSMIADQVREVISAEVPAGTAITVNLVWEPAWDSSMMSDHAREHFGWQ